MRNSFGRKPGRVALLLVIAWLATVTASAEPRDRAKAEILPSTTIAADERCLTARALRDAQQLQVALELFTEAGSECADGASAISELGGLIASAQGLAAEGERAAKKGDTATAWQLYLRAVRIDAGNRSALAGIQQLRSMPPTTKTPFAAAQELKRRGFDNEATSEIVDQIKKGETLDQIPEEEQRELDGDAGGLEGFLDNATPPYEATLRFLVTLAIAAALLFVAWEFIAQWGVRKGRLWLDHAKALRIRYGPKLKVVAPGDDATGVGARLRHTIRTAINRNEDMSIIINTGAAMSFDLPDLGEIDNRFKPVTAILKVLTRRDDVEVTPTWVAQSGNSESRLTVEIVTRTDSEASSASYVTLKSLSEPIGRAAGWTIGTLRGFRPHAIPKFKESTGTDTPAAYAAFLGGVEAFASAERNEARHAFSEAIAQDGNYRPARLNLAFLEITDPSPLVQAVGITRLEELLEELT